MKIYNTAVALAPADLGFLKESIDFRFENNGLTGVINVGAEYSVYVEYGTGIYATKGSRAKRYRGVIKTLTVNGILLKDKRHSRFGTLQLTQDARHSSSIFHRGG